MDYNGMINAICDDGIAAAKADYRRREPPNWRIKLEGSVEGFEEARMTVSPDDLKALLTSANKDTEDARNREDARYWYWRCRALEIEWVANVVSAALYSMGLPTVIIPTYRGLMKAVDILGIKEI